MQRCWQKSRRRRPTKSNLALPSHHPTHADAEEPDLESLEADAADVVAEDGQLSVKGAPASAVAFDDVVLVSVDQEGGGGEDDDERRHGWHVVILSLIS